MFRFAFPRGQGPAYADLPPTLQPCAIAASAPPSDHLRTAALSGLIYVSLVAAAVAFSKLAPPPTLIQALPHPPSGPTIVYDPPHSYRVTLPQTGGSHATGGGTNAVTPVQPAPPTADPTEASSASPVDNHLQVPVGNGVGTASVPSSQQLSGTPAGHGTTVLDVSTTGLAILHQVDPVYPDLAKRAHIQGSVVLMMTVDQVGQPISVQVLEGHPVFHEAAMRAARQWRFEPARMEGRPVMAAFRLTLKFSLR